MYTTDHLYDIYLHSTEGIAWALEGFPGIIVTVLGTAFVLVVCATLYWLFFMPFIRVKDFHEVGFEYLKGESKHRNLKHRDLVNHVRSLKKIDSLPPMYPNGWFGIAEIKDVPNGTVKSVSALGEHFALFRTNEGQIYIVDGYCPHLGADLAVGGRVIGNCIECPFHGWQFDGKTGQCTHVPYTDKIPSFAKIKKWTALERLGWIFVWYHADGAEPDWMPYEVEEIVSGEYVYHGRSEYIVNAHIQEIAENAADLSHFSQVHGPVMLAGSNLEHARSSIWNFCEHVYSDVYWNEDKRPYIAISGGYHALQFFGKIKLLNIKFTHIQVGPGIVFIQLDTFLGTALFVQIQCPIGPMKVRLATNIYCSRYMPTPLCKAIMYTNINTVDRDVEIWNSKTYLMKPMLLKEDYLISRHRRFYQQFYSEKSPKMTFSNDTVAW